MSRWSEFTDVEVYVLKRMAMDSSYDFFVEDNYSEGCKIIHTKLINELAKEDSKRLYNK